MAQEHNGLIGDPANVKPMLPYKDARRQIMAGARLREKGMNRFSVNGRDTTYATGARLLANLALAIVADGEWAITA
jgi:hypothetical protein